MKMGRPEFKVPSQTMVVHDLHVVFEATQNKIIQVLQVCNQYALESTVEVLIHKSHASNLSFAVDCWTSLNHKAYFGVTVHFHNNGRLIQMLLDLVELLKVHSGVNLATAF